MKHRGWRRLAVALAWLGIDACAASAQVTTVEAASVLVFPKVIVDSSWDTSIQLSNTANRPAHAICYYVDGRPTLRGLPPGPGNPPSWTQIDFSLFLVRQQPTQWVVSRGRIADPSDGVCTMPAEGCDGTGFDPGLIPEVPAGFTGELICYEVDASGAPWSGNALIGHTTLTHLGSGEIVKYSAIGVPGLQTNDADGTLCLGGGAGDRCPLGAEYAGCPTEWTLSHPAGFDLRPVDGDASRTSFTIVPCAHDFDTQIPKHLVVTLQVTNEFEATFSASATIDCWADLSLTNLSPIFDRELVGTDWLETRVKASAQTPGGFMIVQQTERESAWPPALMAVASPGHEGAIAAASDLIVVPEEDIR